MKVKQVIYPKEENAELCAMLILLCLRYGISVFEPMKAVDRLIIDVNTETYNENLKKEV